MYCRTAVRKFGWQQPGLMAGHPFLLSSLARKFVRVYYDCLKNSEATQAVTDAQDRVDWNRTSTAAAKLAEAGASKRLRS
jgi:hypothetical protein